jgi:hypoxanthine phosphoribosyltransferase
MIYLFFRVKHIDSQIKQYPSWIDPTLASVLHKKANIPLWYKMWEVLYQRGNYITWSMVEKDLDILIDKIKAQPVQFDAIVGIKSGGAILTKYIATKLNLPYYYVKLSDADYKCKKNPSDTFKYVFNYYLFKKEKKYMVCEPIKTDISHQNILLFDELILTGGTLVSTINYLLKEKKVNQVVPATIFSKKDSYSGYKPLYIKKCLYDGIWPWGYDN